MTALTVEELCRAVGGTLLEWTNAGVTQVCTDSRSVPQGALFVPLVGEKFDGHDYLDTALAAGAAGCLCSRVPKTLQKGKFYIQVADTLLALKALACAYRAKFTLPMVQITGSVGKTTTKEMIASVLAQKLSVLKTEANFNNEIGTPMTILRLAQTHQAAVIETGMDHFGEIRYLGEMVRPTVAVITNIGDAHIGNVGGTRLGTLKAKSEIFENLQPGGLIVLTGDDELLNTIDQPFTTIRCGESDTSDVRISQVVDRGVDGITCRVTTQKKSYELAIPSPGRHMTYPAAMAVAIGEAMGLTREQICAGVAAYEPTGSRMHIVRLPDNRRVLDDCYNANPQSMGAALHILANTDCTGKMAVLGDMGDLGDLSASAHNDMGRLAAELGIDTIVAIGPKSEALAAGARSTGNSKVYYFTDKTSALEEIKRAFTPGSVVLVKASHAMEFGKIVQALEETYD
jgi:UDP-N-acetylmuramoyl-tripeptide--D-alanyl-D-alanine ligase